MTYTTIWTVLLLGTLASLTYNVVSSRRRSARDEPTPVYAAGAISGTISMLCLIVAQLVGIDSQLASVLLAAAVAFLAADVVISIRARRKTPRPAA